MDTKLPWGIVASLEASFNKDVTQLSLEVPIIRQLKILM
jgi:hypothetical protein